MMTLILFARNDQSAAQVIGYFHIIITIDAQHIFHHIARTLHVATISGHEQFQPFFIFREHPHLQALCNALDGVGANLFPDEPMHIIVGQAHAAPLDGRRINVVDGHRNLSAREFFAQDGRLLQGINDIIGIDAALKPIAGIRAESVSTGRLANPSGMKIGSLQHHAMGCCIGSATLSAQHTRNAHGFAGIANAEVVLVQRALFAI